MGRPNFPSCVVILATVALSALLIPSAAAMKIDAGFTSDDTVGYFAQFCWEGQGGSVTGRIVSSTTPEAPIRLLMCGSQDTANIRFSGSSSACSIPSNACAYDIPLVSVRQTINISNPKGYYGFFILNCASKSYSMDISIDLLNPGNEGLSCEMLGMPAITRRLIALWSIVLAVCVFDACFNYWNRNRRMEAWIVSKGMQPWISVCAGARLIQVCMAMKTFDDMSVYGRNSAASILLMYLFAGIGEGSILAVCVLFSKGHTTLTNTLTLSDKKQVIFIGLWLFVSVFLNDLFRGFFLFSLIIAYICLCRIVTNRCSAAVLALRASARNARSLHNNPEGATRMELKALFFRVLLALLIVFVTSVCVVLVIIAFVPYVKEAYISSFLIKDSMLFVILFHVTVVPRLLQWRFNYMLEHEIVNQMPQNENFGNGILAGIFEARNFREIETTETFCRSVYVVVPPFDEVADEYPVLSLAMDADARDDPARLSPGATFVAVARQPPAPQQDAPQEAQIELQSVQYSVNGRGSSR